MRVAASVGPAVSMEVPVLDLVFLSLGLGGFAVMGAYAVLCDRL